MHFSPEAAEKYFTDYKKLYGDDIFFLEPKFKITCGSTSITEYRDLTPDNIKYLQDHGFEVTKI